MNRQVRHNLWLYAVGVATSRCASQFKFLAVTSLTYAITGSPLLTALQMAASSVPFILLARLVGTIVDRHDPRKISAVSYLLQASLSLLFLLTRDVYVIVLLNLLVASVSVFHVVARNRLLPQIVGRENLFKANARLASINGAALLLAPALAGSLLAIIGVSWSLAINSLGLMVPGIIMLWLRPVSEEVVAKACDKGQGKSPVREFLQTQPQRKVWLALFVVYTVGMWSVSGVFYPYCLDVLKAGPEVMGWSISTYFGAYLITGLALEKWGKVLRDMRLVPVGFFLGALVWGGYTLTTSVPVVLLLSALDGVFYTFTLTRMDIWVQEEAPPEARGRITAVIRSWEEVAIIAGQVGGGAVASIAGIVGSISISTLGTSALILGGAYAGRAHRSENMPTVVEALSD